MFTNLTKLFESTVCRWTELLNMSYCGIILTRATGDTWWMLTVWLQHRNWASSVSGTGTEDVQWTQSWTRHNRPQHAVNCELLVCFQLSDGYCFSTSKVLLLLKVKKVQYYRSLMMLDLVTRNCKVSAKEIFCKPKYLEKKLSESHNILKSRKLLQIHIRVGLQKKWNLWYLSCLIYDGYYALKKEDLYF